MQKKRKTKYVIAQPIALQYSNLYQHMFYAYRCTYIYTKQYVQVLLNRLRTAAEIL